MSNFDINKVRELMGIDYEVYTSPFANEETFSASVNAKHNRQERTKLYNNLEEVIKLSGLKDGDTISFHHHFRDGDLTVALVMDVIEKLGYKDLTVAASSFTNAHTCMIEYIENGVVSALQTSGCRDKLGEAVSGGILKKPMIIRSHGGRAAAIESGRLKIDVAFLAVSSADCYGNANGTVGKTVCGSLGYAMVDAKHAKTTVLLTDTVVPYPNYPISIPQTDVDFVVEVEGIGDSKGIMSGATRFTNNPKELLQAKNVLKAIVNTDFFKDGFSWQTGTGGAALAVSRYLKDVMITENIKGDFILGGITQGNVDLLEEGLFAKILDTQDFDLAGVQSLGENPKHIEISAGMYASMYNKGAAVNKLDYVILSALEIDTDFNVNVITGSDGVIRGASGGHSDTAAAANVSIIVTPLLRGRIPCVVEKVQTIITPGASVDILVTDIGIAVNPLRPELKEQIESAGVKTMSIEEMKEKAYSITGRPDDIEYDDQIVSIVEFRDGTVLDVIRKVK